MKNQSVSDFVAAAMDAVLNSKEHKSLFATQYKKAGESMCAKHGKMDSCAADDQEARKKKDSSDDSSAWDDNDARRKKKDSDEESDSSSAWDDNDARRKKKDDDDDSCMADDDDNDARRKKKDSDEDESDADDNNDEFAPASGTRVAPLDPKKPEGAQKMEFPADKITAKPPAPAAQKADDGFETSAAFDVAIDSLLTASAALDSVGLGRGSALTLKIASLVVEAKKKDKKSKDSKKSSKDSQSAKDKKSKDSKKSDSKSSKDSHSAKDKKSDSKSSKDSKDSKKSFLASKKK